MSSHSDLYLDIIQLFIYLLELFGVLAACKAIEVLQPRHERS